MYPDSHFSILNMVENITEIWVKNREKSQVEGQNEKLHRKNQLFCKKLEKSQFLGNIAIFLKNLLKRAKNHQGCEKRPI
jgi:hypothetical protein